MRFLLLALISTSALAQIPGNLGYVPTAQYQTSKDVTLYVSPDGGDSSVCGTISRPCKTPRGAWLRVPPNVYHNVIINVADGTYDLSDAGTILSAKYIDAPVSVTFLGNLTVVETGQMTDGGTYALNSFPVKPTLTDSLKSWSTDAYQGMFIRNKLADGGTTVVMPVSANSATALSLVASTTAFNSSLSYEIVTPGAQLTSDKNTLGVAGIVGGGALKFQNLSIATTSLDVRVSAVQIGNTSTSSSNTSTTANGAVSAKVDLINNVVTQTNSGFYMSQVSSGANVTVTNSSFVGATPAMCMLVSGTSITLTGVYCRANFAGFYFTSNTTTSLSNVVVDQVGYSVSYQYGILCNANSSCSLNTTSYNCKVASNKPAVRANTSLIYVGGNGLSVATCAIGVRITNISKVTTFPSWYMSGVATEILVDATTSTWASFNALTPKVIFGDTGSVISYNEN